jgi:hypothetical protein
LGERNRLLLTTEHDTKKEKFPFPFNFSRMSHLKHEDIYIYLKKFLTLRHDIYDLQLAGLLYLAVGVLVLIDPDLDIPEQYENGKLDFWY